tara:strand:- start:43 stop:1020 length:978 start_codon:yes stop_codon:yes gene_type:complete
MDQNFGYTTWDKAPFGSEWLAHVDKGGLWPNKNEVMVGADQGAAGFASNYRHAGNVALIKNEIANKLATDTGINWLDKSTRKIGNIAGGIAGWGLGLGHELGAASPIFNKDINTGILDYGEVYEKKNPEAGFFNTEFLEDMAANKFGAWHGKTGITSANVVNEIAKSLATEKGSDIDYLNELALKHPLDTRNMFWGIGRNIRPTSVMNQEDFRKRFINRYYKSAHEKNIERLRQEKIKQNLLAEAKAAADRRAQQQATIAANKAAAKTAGDKPQPIYHQETKSQDRGGRDIGSRVSDSYEKQQSAQYGMLAKGGLVNFYKYGGFV